MKVENDVQLADVPKVPVQDLHKQVDHLVEEEKEGRKEGGRDRGEWVFPLFFSVFTSHTKTYLEGDELIVRVIHGGNEEERGVPLVHHL